MLITTCSHCRARFRVTPQQLNLHARGRCAAADASEVFNGFEALERFPDDDTGARIARRARSGATMHAAAGIVGHVEPQASDDDCRRSRRSPTRPRSRRPPCRGG